MILFQYETNKDYPAITMLRNRQKSLFWLKLSPGGHLEFPIFTWPREWTKSPTDAAGDDVGTV